MAVPAILAVLTATQSTLQNSITQFLVLPPFAVVIFLLFREPFGKWANLRSIVVLRSVLAMLLHATSPMYVLGVAGASTTIAIVFLLWRRFLIAPLLLKEEAPPIGSATSAAIETLPTTEVTQT